MYVNVACDSFIILLPLFVSLRFPFVYATQISTWVHENNISGHMQSPLGTSNKSSIVLRFFPLVSSPKKWNSFVLAVRWSFFPFLSVSVCLFFAFFALYWNRFSREEWKKIPATNQEIWREKKLATEQNVYVSTSVILSISLTRSINVIHLDPFTRSTSFACLGYVVYILSPLYMYINICDFDTRSPACSSHTTLTHRCSLSIQACSTQHFIHRQ